MPEEDLSRGQNKTLRGKIHRHIRWPHRDVDGFEVHPHRGRGVGQSARSEGVAAEQEAEVIGGEWLGHGAQRKQGQTQQHFGQANRRNGKGPPPSEFSECPLHSTKESGT